MYNVSMTTETIISKLRKRLSMLEELVQETETLLERAEAQLEEEMFPVKIIDENEAIEMEQLIDERKNPDDYVSSDIKDLESSIA